MIDISKIHHVTVIKNKENNKYKIIAHYFTGKKRTIYMETYEFYKLPKTICKFILWSDKTTHATIKTAKITRYYNIFGRVEQ